MHTTRVYTFTHPKSNASISVSADMEFQNHALWKSQIFFRLPNQLFLKIPFRLQKKSYLIVRTPNLTCFVSLPFLLFICLSIFVHVNTSGL